MAKSTRQYVFEGLELLPGALIPFVEKRLETALTGHWQVQVVEKVAGLKPNGKGEIAWDQAALFNAIDRFWVDAFKSVLGRAERALVNELVDVRNKLSHNDAFTYDDAERALDSMRRLMEAISAGEVASELGKMRDTILRTKFTELQRNEERRKTQRFDISVETVAGLAPWRQVVEPHQDVATGEFQQAEFAADLAKVHNGSAPSEYRNPREFFARTYLTEGLSNLLIGAAKRFSKAGGDPVVELQTNFGGGKTHSMLALYHMASGTSVQDLPGLDQLLSQHGLGVPGNINRAVLVGTSRGPQDVLNVEGGLRIRTTWGELAWQLGRAEGFAMVADNDASGIAPGSNLLQKLFDRFSPSLILIDEWVAYLRQVYKVEGLPSGSFDANLSFVQSLTEAVKASPGTLLVASLPASQIEVGGEGGQEALSRLKQTFSRVESSWRPASQEESYEIVRRRLFKEIPGERFHHRDNALKQYAKLYRENAGDFPQGCGDEDYRRKLEKSYPIHPEMFDQLYTSWGALEKFQRTRGVLRLMAQVIHELWMGNDPSVMIMPGSVAISSARVEPELLHYLEASWQSIIAADVDGITSTPYKIDESAPGLNKYSATRRVARAIFMATAPTHGQVNKGLDDKQINLGVVQPGERPAIFGDALRRLTNQAKFMHSDLGRHWYSMSPSLNRIAADRGGQIEEALVLLEIDKALGIYINGLTDRGHFDAVQVAPGSSADVPDEPGGVRAVVLGVAHAHSGREISDALTEARDILMQRGSTPRVYRNMLVFLAAEQRQLDNVKSAMRSALAWAEIVRETDRLNLTQSDSALAKAKLIEANETLKTRIKEAWCYLIYPTQETAQSDLEWTREKVPAQDGLLARASKKLAVDEGLFPELGQARLDGVLQKYIWNGKDHLLLRDLWEYLNRYTYMPRLKNRQVLAKTVQAAIGGLVPGVFAYAERWDEATSTYAGLLIDHASGAVVVIDSYSVILRPTVAEAHRPKPATAVTPTGEAPPPIFGPGGAPAGGPTVTGPNGTPPTSPPPRVEKNPTRFSGTVMISPDRPARTMHQIVEAIVEQLTTIAGSEVTLRLEIDAEVPSGLDRAKVRTLIENATTLGFIEKIVK
jgi:predicted AAA+ superfamily ATPase